MNALKETVAPEELEALAKDYLQEILFVSYRQRMATARLLSRAAARIAELEPYEPPAGFDVGRLQGIGGRATIEKCNDGSWYALALRLGETTARGASGFPTPHAAAEWARNVMKEDESPDGNYS